MDEAAEKGSRSKDDSLGKKTFPDIGYYSLCFTLLNDELVYQGLAEEEVLLAFQDSFHLQVVELHVGLSPRRPYCRSFLGIQPAELNPRLIGVLAHLPSQGVDLFYQLSLGQPPD